MEASEIKQYFLCENLSFLTPVERKKVGHIEANQLFFFLVRQCRRIASFLKVLMAFFSLCWPYLRTCMRDVLFTKLVRSRGLNIRQVLFLACFWIV